MSDDERGGDDASDNDSLNKLLLRLQLAFFQDTLGH